MVRETVTLTEGGRWGGVEYSRPRFHTRAVDDRYVMTDKGSVRDYYSQENWLE